MKLKDSLILGILAGLLAPGIGFFIFYLVNFNNESLGSFLDMSIREKLLSPLLSLCAVINLAVFYAFIYFERYQTSKGVILATLLYGSIIVALKFIL